MLTVVQMLRAKGVVGKFVEFYRPGADHLGLADRATIANMAPEYGATCGFFPVDGKPCATSTFTGPRPRPGWRWSRPMPRRKGMWRDGRRPRARCSPILELDLGFGGAQPGRPQAAAGPHRAVGHGRSAAKAIGSGAGGDSGKQVAGRRQPTTPLRHGDVVIAAITSCTNTSNPSRPGGRRPGGAQGARTGLQVKPWVKTSLAPGSQVVTDYLEAAGSAGRSGRARLRSGRLWLHHLYRQLRPAARADLADAIDSGDLHVAAVLSGNRNFEGRVSPRTRLNYLASPPLVVAYAHRRHRDPRPDVPSRSARTATASRST